MKIYRIRIETNASKMLLQTENKAECNETMFIKWSTCVCLCVYVQNDLCEYHIHKRKTENTQTHWTKYLADYLLNKVCRQYYDNVGSGPNEHTHTQGIETHARIHIQFIFFLIYTCCNVRT